jgi:hypothetical protein
MTFQFIRVRQYDKRCNLSLYWRCDVGAGRESGDPEAQQRGKTCIPNEIAFAAEPDRPGTYYLDIAPEPEILENVQARVEQAHAAGANCMILSAHWGPQQEVTHEYLET